MGRGFEGEHADMVVEIDVLGIHLQRSTEANSRAVYDLPKSGNEVELPADRDAHIRRAKAPVFEQATAIKDC